MQKYQGKCVFSGIAIGKIKVFEDSERKAVGRKTVNAEVELVRFHKAKEETGAQLTALYEQTLESIGKQEAAIFEMHGLVLEDTDYIGFIEKQIVEKQVNAEYAVDVAKEYFMKQFALLEDDYMQDRAMDIQDVSKRLQYVLMGGKEKALELEEPVILVAENLTPSQTVQLDKEKILAFITRGGSVHSHTAILARTMGIPALVGTNVAWENMQDGCFGIVDGANGMFYVAPDEETLQYYRKRQQEEKEKVQHLQEMKGKETISLDGQRLWIGANIGSLNDLEAVLQYDADGIGLFRSEFLYLEREDYPTEEEQFRIYKTVVETMDGKPIVIRTLDIGADKQCGYFRLGEEENPALGYRAIRICLTQPEIFKIQLRAVFRASAYGELAIMYPMIISVEELHRIRQLTEEVKAELITEGIAFGNPRQGIMIETPAAVMMSDVLAKEVDFFSIGTNDLTQYTLAIDRQNPKLAPFYNPHHPAVLRMIEMVVENAHKAGIPVGICGELGADMQLTREFLAMGVDELSVSPGSVLPLRKVICETNVAEYKKKYRESTSGGKCSVELTNK